MGKNWQIMNSKYLFTTLKTFLTHHWHKIIIFKVVLTNKSSFKNLFTLCPLYTTWVPQLLKYSQKIIYAGPKADSRDATHSICFFLIYHQVFHELLGGLRLFLELWLQSYQFHFHVVHKYIGLQQLDQTILYSVTGLFQRPAEHALSCAIKEI